MLYFGSVDYWGYSGKPAIRSYIYYYTYEYQAVSLVKRDFMTALTADKFWFGDFEHAGEAQNSKCENATAETFTVDFSWAADRMSGRCGGHSHRVLLIRRNGAPRGECVSRATIP